jgi:hypothetical protein
VASILESQSVGALIAVVANHETSVVKPQEQRASKRKILAAHDLAAILAKEELRLFEITIERPSVMTAAWTNNSIGSISHDNSLPRVRLT